jgi:hypothetical protein
MIDISKDTYYVAVWFVASVRQDWLCVAYLRNEDRRFVAEYRYRYSAGGGPFDARDRREWFIAEFHPGDTEAKVIEAFDRVVAALERAGYPAPGVAPERIMIAGDGDVLRGAMARASFANFTTVWPDPPTPEGGADLLS